MEERVITCATDSVHVSAESVKTREYISKLWENCLKSNLNIAAEYIAQEHMKHPTNGQSWLN